MSRRVIGDLRAGESFVVHSVILGQEIGKRLADMGFTQGVQGRVVRKALLGDPVEIEILGYFVTLRRSEARGVVVERSGSQD